MIFRYIEYKKQETVESNTVTYTSSTSLAITANASTVRSDDITATNSLATTNSVSDSLLRQSLR